MKWPRNRASIRSIMAVCICATACVPPFADYQSARLVPQNRAEITPFYSAVWFSSDGETEKIQDHFGVQFATGVSDRTELRFRYERIKIDDDGASVLAAGPKFSLIKDRVALFTPVGTSFGEGIDTSELWQLQPTLLLTGMPAPTIEVNGSAKMLVWLNGGGDTLLAFNLGIGLSPGSGSVWLRPEVGYLTNPGESRHAFHAGIGLSFTTGAR